MNDNTTFIFNKEKINNTYYILFIKNPSIAYDKQNILKNMEKMHNDNEQGSN